MSVSPEHSYGDIVHLHFQLTEKCNLNCPGCYLPERSGEGKGVSEIEERVFVPLKKYGVRHVTLTGGEPLLHEQWLAICSAAARNFLNILFVCNGTLLSAENFRKLQKAGVSEVKISIDSLKATVHDRSRGKRGTLQKVMDNLAEIRALPAEIRTAMPLGVITTVTEENVNELEDIAETVSQLGASHVLFQPYHPFEEVYPSSAAIKRPEVSGTFLDNLAKQLERLGQIKKKRPFFIDNNEQMLALFPDFYVQHNGPEQLCGADRYIFVNSSFQVRGCLFSAPLGDLALHDPADLLQSKKWQAFDRFRKGCTLCLMGCQFVTEAERKREIGWRLCDKGDLAGAQAAFAESGRLSPTFQARHGLAVVAKLENDYEKAIQEFTAINREVPEFPDAFVECADSQRLAGQLDEALTTITKALTLFPGNCRGHHLHGLILRDRGHDNDRVRSEFAKATELNSRNPWFHYDLGKLLKEQGEVDQARRELGKAISLNAEIPWFHYDLGKLLKEQGEVDQARRELSKAISLNAEIPWFHYDLAVLLKDLGEVDQACQRLEKAVSLDDQIYYYHYDLGKILLGQKNYFEARKSFQQASYLNPDFLLPQYYLLSLSIRQGDIIGSLRQVLRLIVPSVKKITSLIIT